MVKDNDDKIKSLEKEITRRKEKNKHYIRAITEEK